MDKTEMKKLLKYRESFVEIKKKILQKLKEDDMCEEVVEVFKTIEKNIDQVIADMDPPIVAYCESDTVGLWMLRIKGITPDIAAGLMAYFDVKNKNCAAQFIKYSGVSNHNDPHNDHLNKLMEEMASKMIKASESLYASLYYAKVCELIKLGEEVPMYTIHMRAKRYMLKVFISHVFEEMYRVEHNGQLPERYKFTDTVIIEPEVPFSM